jgi:hypothetical protein
MDTVLDYVTSASDEVLECRVRGHRWPFAKKRNGFTGYSLSTNLFLNRERCKCCGLAYRLEYWEVTRVSKGHTKFERVAVELEYQNDENGNSYLLEPGHGYMGRKQIDEAVMTMSLSNVTVSELKKQALAAAK